MNKGQVLETQKIKNGRLKLLRRDWRAWKALAGIWKDKKIQDPLKWQREIRKEWERRLP